MIRPNVIVHLANLAGAKKHYEHMVCQILEAEGPRRAAELVKWVAQEMYYEELRVNGGAFGVSMDTIIQDELETLALCPILSINDRNLEFMRIKGISRIQLEVDNWEDLIDRGNLPVYCGMRTSNSTHSIQ